MTPLERAVQRGEVHADRVEHVDPGRPFGGDPDLVQVVVVAVAGADAGDLFVGAVGDDDFALPEADLEDPPLPPGRATGLPSYCWTWKFVAATFAGSGWNQIRLPAWSVIIGPAMPLPW